MIFYIGIVIINLILYAILYKIKNGKKIYLGTILTLLFFISSFRSRGIGADYPVYINVFERIGTYINNYPMEKGYLYLNFFISQFTNNYIIFSLFINLIIFYSLYQYIKDNVDKEDYFWIMFIFIANPYLYIQSTFNVIRQTIAIAIILFGIKHINNKKYLRYIIYVILAAQIHKISYIYLLLIVIKKINLKDKGFIILLITSLFINLFGKKLLLIKYISNILGYTEYLEYKNTLFNFSAYILFISISVLFLLYVYKKIEIKEKDKLFVDTYLVSLSLLPVFITNDIMYRVYIGLVFMSLPGMAIMLKNIKEKFIKENIYIKSIFVSYYIMLLLLFLQSVIKSNNTRYIPFTFFWQ